MSDLARRASQSYASKHIPERHFIAVIAILAVIAIIVLIAIIARIAIIAILAIQNYISKGI